MRAHNVLSQNAQEGLDYVECASHTQFECDISTGIFGLLFAGSLKKLSVTRSVAG